MQLVYFRLNGPYNQEKDDKHMPNRLTEREIITCNNVMFITDANALPKCYNNATIYQ